MIWCGVDVGDMYLILPKIYMFHMCRPFVAGASVGAHYTLNKKNLNPKP